MPVFFLSRLIPVEKDQKKKHVEHECNTYSKFEIFFFNKKTNNTKVNSNDAI